MIKTLRYTVLLCAALLACDGGGEQTTQGQGGAGGAGGMGAGGEGACTADKPCAMGVCIFGQDACTPGATGMCQAGFTCDGPPSGPVCGCDGKVFEAEYAECTLWGQGKPFDSSPDACATGTFTCGTLQCKRHIEVCVATSGGVMAETTYECKAVADAQGSCAHGIADCSCLDLMKLGCPDANCCMADMDFQEKITIALP
jgi:hypothetical protein